MLRTAQHASRCVSMRGQVCADDASHCQCAQALSWTSGRTCVSAALCSATATAEPGSGWWRVKGGWAGLSAEPGGGLTADPAQPNWRLSGCGAERAQLSLSRVTARKPFSLRTFREEETARRTADDNSAAAPDTARGVDGEDSRTAGDTTGHEGCRRAAAALLAPSPAVSRQLNVTTPRCRAALPAAACGGGALAASPDAAAPSL